MLHQRKNPRAKFHDYMGGEYFITICTKEKKHYFGHIANRQMIFTPIGEFAHKVLAEIKSHYIYADIPLYVVMPNHIHAIICIQTDNPEYIPTKRTALSIVIGGYKQAVTCFARKNHIEFDWQSRYHDHIIRGIYDGNRIAEYIENNISNWDKDCFYP